MFWEKILPENPFDLSRVWKVVASAGAGKSTSLRRVILDLVHNGVQMEKIMYLIYNKNPAEAFRKDLEIQGLDPKKMMWIGTHHSIACRLLQIDRKKILSGKTLMVWGEKNGFSFGTPEKDLNPDQNEKTETIWDEVLRSINLKIADEETQFDPLERRLLSALKQAEAEGFYIHDRYLEKSIRLNFCPSGVEYVLFDESQDNNRLQFSYIEYLKTLPQLKGIMLAGDDKQAINIYRGGRPNLFLSFEADRYVCLGKTWRNPPKILAYGNGIAGPIKNRSPLSSVSDKEEAGIVDFFDELEDVIPTIKKDLCEGSDVFLLSRLNAFKFRAMGILRAYGVPIRLKSYENMKKVFKAMKNLAVKIDTPQGFAFEDLLPILPGEETERGELNRTAYWKRGSLKKFQAGNYSLEKESEVPLRVEYEMFAAGECSSLEIDWASFGFLPSFWEDVRGSLSGNIPKGVFRGMDAEDEDYVSRIIKNFGEDAKAVWPSTIHGAKGAECDVAVILTNINYATRNTESDNPDAERRVYYTAVTRARKKVYVCSIFDSKMLHTELL